MAERILRSVFVDVLPREIPLEHASPPPVLVWYLAKQLSESDAVPSHKHNLSVLG
jgi:hypothetical protein